MRALLTAVGTRGDVQPALALAIELRKLGHTDVSHDVLFPQVAAVVHHGGAGTTATGARAGVPQIITPMGGDQFYWASRVVALGVGATTSHAAMTEESLAHVLREAFDPAVEHRAQAVADHVGADGAAVAARRLDAEYGRRR